MASTRLKEQGNFPPRLTHEYAVTNWLLDGYTIGACYTNLLDMIKNVNARKLELAAEPHRATLNSEVSSINCSGPR